MSLLLDALKQAADKKQQPNKKVKKTAKESEAEKALSTNELKLELEEIQDDLAHDSDETVNDKTIVDSSEDKKESEDHTPLEMDQFDPDEISLEKIEEPDDKENNLTEQSSQEQSVTSAAEETPATNIQQNGTPNEKIVPEDRDSADNSKQTQSKKEEQPLSDETAVTKEKPLAKEEPSAQEKPSETEKTAANEKPQAIKEPLENKKQAEKQQTNEANSGKTRNIAPENARIIAGPEKKKKSGSKILVIGLLGLGVLIAGSFLGYLYYIDQDSQISTNIANLSRPPTTLIKPIDDLSAASNNMESNIQADAKAISADQPVQGSITKIETIATDSTTNTEVTQNEVATPLDSESQEPESTAPEQQGGRPQSKIASTVSKKDEAVIAAEELPPTLDSVVNSHPFIAATPMEKGPVVIEPAITIKKNSMQAVAADNINAGYSLFTQGNYQQAKLKYLKANKVAPDSIDSLLGLGAIAIIEEDKQTAKSYYQRALSLNPQNTTALNALSAIDKSLQSDETQIKQTIAQDPNNPSAYFNLGNYYLEREKWNLALRAFNQANKLAPGSPDIVYNIAISLDNLDNIKPAINTYKKAVQLSTATTASFNTNAVIDYIKQLEIQLKTSESNGN